MSLNHIILGLLRTPQSGYDLKAAFDRSLNYFWPAELSQIYRVLQKMEDDKLLTSEKQPSPQGPARRVYSLTDPGRDELRSWLDQGPIFGDERFTYLAQVFFLGEHDDLNKTQNFVTQMRETFIERLAIYDTIEQAWQSGHEHYPDLETSEGFHMHLTLRMGLHRMNAAVQWCDETLSRIEQRIKDQSIKETDRSNR